MNIRRIAPALVLIALLFYCGCSQPVLPDSCSSAVLNYIVTNGRLAHVQTIINGDAPLPPRYKGTALVSGKTTLVVHPSMKAQGKELLKYFATSFEYFEALKLTPLPSIDITLVQVKSMKHVPSRWQGVIKSNKLTTIFYIPPGDFITSAGKWTRINDFLSTQILGTWHEILELSMIFGNGVRIGFGDDEKLRWLREGLSTYLAEQTLDRAFLCRPYKGSQLEHKFYYATLVGDKVLDWKERSSAKYNTGYSASLGIMHAACDASKGSFPWKFLQLCANKRYQNPDELLGAMATTLSCNVAKFVASIRRPIPNLFPAHNGTKFVVPRDFLQSPDAPLLSQGDIINAVDNYPINHAFELDLALWRAGKKDDFVISVTRNGSTMDVFCRPVVGRHALEKR